MTCGPCRPIPDSETNGDAWCKCEAMLVGEDTYDVLYNPPTVLKVRVSMHEDRCVRQTVGISYSIERGCPTLKQRQRLDGGMWTTSLLVILWGFHSCCWFVLFAITTLHQSLPQRYLLLDTSRFAANIRAAGLPPWHRPALMR